MLCFPRESRVRHVLDETQKEKALESLASQIFRYEGAGSQRSSQDVDPVDFRPESVAFLVEGVGQLASIGNVMDWQFREDITRSDRYEIAPTGLSGGLDEDAILDCLGCQPGLLPCQGREALC
jgi:hypothetical protein